MSLVYRVVLADGEVVSVRGHLSYLSSCIDGLGTAWRQYNEGESHANNWVNLNNREGQDSLNMRAMRAQLEVMKKKATFAEAVQNLCVIAHLPFDPNDAETTVHNLVQWNVQVATDPSVSKEAYNLHRQITVRNEFLARDIFPLTDKLDGVDPLILEKLRHFIEESPGDTPYDPTEFENFDVSEFDQQDRHPDPEIESDVAAGREAARRRLENRKVPNVLRSQADAPVWLVRRHEEARKGAVLAARRKALKLKREQLAVLIRSTPQKIQRVEQGLPLIGHKRIRLRMVRELTRLEQLKKESE